jgi:hypothetical protein
MIHWVIRLEALFVFIFSLYCYFLFGGNWLLFFAIWIIPDIGMIGFLKNKKLGAICYNITHTYLFSISFIIAGYFLNHDLLLALGFIFTNHIGLDRFLGFGLKYSSGFKDTHIQHL